MALPTLSRRLKWILGGVAAMLVAPPLGLFGYVGYLEASEAICTELRGGLWSRVSESCITESCYADGSCGYRAYPGGYCDRVAIGDPISKLYLYLGNPTLVSDDKLGWHQSKIDSRIGVVATIRDEKLVSLDCRSNPNFVAMWSETSSGSAN